MVVGMVEPSTAYINNGLVQKSQKYFEFFEEKNIFKIPYFQKSP